MKVREMSKENYSATKKRWNIKQISKSVMKMEHYKISNLLNDSTVSNFSTKKWIKVNDLSCGQCSVNERIRFNTSMLRSDLCDAFIVVKGRMKIIGTNFALFFKNNGPFKSCILKINKIL